MFDSNRMISNSVTKRKFNSDRLTLNNNFLLNLKRQYTKLEKLLVKNLQFFQHYSCFVIFKGSD